MKNLVQYLSTGNHPIVVGGPQASSREFKKRLMELGHIFVKFTDTAGGTDLGVKIDKDATDLSQALFEQQKGTIHVEGTLTLNYVKVRCIADIDLATLQGIGKLIMLEPVMQ